MPVAVANPKGGSGKTTVAVGLADVLAADGRDVLLVDVSPAGDATVDVGLEATYVGASPNLNDAIVEGSVDPRSLVYDAGRYDVVPSSIDLVAGARQLPDLGAIDRALEGLSYDVVLLDLPPRIDPLTDAALVAADRVLVPVAAAPEAGRSIERLFDQLDSLESCVGTARDVVGFVATPVRNDGVARETVAWLESTFEDRAPVWTVPERVGLRRIRERRGSLSNGAPDGDVRRAFETIAEEL